MPIDVEWAFVDGDDGGDDSTGKDDNNNDQQQQQVLELVTGLSDYDIVHVG